MPSQTFMNLDKEKQDKLIKCAMQEFANNMYPDVSINKIITNAKIPRGSFYMYFKDKEDLFEYLLTEHTKKLNETTKQTLIKNSGDLRQTFIDIYNNISNKIYQKELLGIFKNIFIFINLTGKKMPENPPGYDLFLYVKNDINTKNLKSTDLSFIFYMLLHTLLISIDELLKHNNPEENKRQYLQKIDIICYGIYKEEK